MRLERTIHRRGGSKGAWSREGRPSCPHKQLRKEGDGAMLKMDNQQGPTVQHRELCSMLCGSRAERGMWGEWMHICLWLSPFTVHLELSQHCSSAIPHYKITSSKEKKNGVACHSSRGTHAWHTGMQQRPVRVILKAFWASLHGELVPWWLVPELELSCCNSPGSVMIWQSATRRDRLRLLEIVLFFFFFLA